MFRAVLSVTKLASTSPFDMKVALRIGSAGILCGLLCGCIARKANTPAGPSSTQVSTAVLATTPVPAATEPHATLVATEPASSSSTATLIPTPRPVVLRGVVFALLADNELMALTVADGMVRAQYRVGATPASDDLRYTGHYMALSNDRKRLFVLAPGAQGQAHRVAIVDVGTAKLLASYVLDDSGVVFHGLAVGPSSGRIYLFGDRSGDAVVTVLNPETGVELAHWIARKANGYNWLPYEGAVSADEQALYISYHGMDTTGVDRFMILGDGLQRCPPPKDANVGCLGGHGGFVLYGNGIVLGDGGGMMFQEDLTGTIRSAYDTGVGGHQMEFVIDSQTSRLYTVKSCGYAGGVSTINLTAGGTYTLTKYGEINWLVTPAPPEILAAPQPGILVKTVPCGERLALSPDSWLVVGKTDRPDPNVANPGVLIILDAFTAKVLRSFPTVSEPVDVLVVADP